METEPMTDPAIVNKAIVNEASEIGRLNIEAEHIVQTNNGLQADDPEEQPSQEAEVQS